MKKATFLYNTQPVEGARKYLLWSITGELQLTVTHSLGQRSLRPGDLCSELEVFSLLHRNDIEVKVRVMGTL